MPSEKSSDVSLRVCLVEGVLTAKVSLFSCLEIERVMLCHAPEATLALRDFLTSCDAEL